MYRYVCNLFHKRDRPDGVRRVKKSDISLSQLFIIDVLGVLNFEILQKCCLKGLGYVYHKNSILCGFILFDVLPDETSGRNIMTILYVGVHSEYRRIGIGTQLFNAVHAVKRKYALCVNVDNLQAIALYEKLGYVRTLLLKEYYKYTPIYTNPDAHYMIRPHTASASTLRMKISDFFSRMYV
jgi:ribosomal protein S18 acetylase RimI-like enzyme